MQAHVGKIRENERILTRVAARVIPPSAGLLVSRSQLVPLILTRVAKLYFFRVRVPSSLPGSYEGLLPGSRNSSRHGAASAPFDRLARSRCWRIRSSLCPTRPRNGVNPAGKNSGVCVLAIPDSEEIYIFRARGSTGHGGSTEGKTSPGQSLTEKISSSMTLPASTALTTSPGSPG
jgi:hypothetical protein